MKGTTCSVWSVLRLRCSAVCLDVDALFLVVVVNNTNASLFVILKLTCHHARTKNKILLTSEEEGDKLDGDDSIMVDSFETIADIGQDFLPPDQDSFTFGSLLVTFFFVKLIRLVRLIDSIKSDSRLMTDDSTVNVCDTLASH